RPGPPGDRRGGRHGRSQGWPAALPGRHRHGRVICAPRTSKGQARAAMSEEAESPEPPAAEAPRRLIRRDYRVIIAITSVAFLLRLLSPILPDFASNPTSWPPVR